MGPLTLDDEAAYRAHYVENFCKRPLHMPLPDGSSFPVYFSPKTFDHAFFESSARNRIKDTAISLTRASRIPLIESALKDLGAPRMQGFDKQTRSHNAGRCVTVVSADDFVVVVRLGLTRSGLLRGTFVTCYVADNSIGKIMQAPVWTAEDCRDHLGA